MSEINRILRAASWRLGLSRFLMALVVGLAGALVLAIVARVIEQLWPLAPLPWVQIGLWSLGASLVGALGWSIIARPKPGAVARRVDEGAGLRESISTALCIAGQTDPWSKATFELARERARTVKVREAVPIRSPRFWPVPMALALSLLVVFLAVPQRIPQALVEQEQKEAAIIEAKVQVQQAQKKIEELTSKFNLEAPAQDPAEANKPEAATPEEIRRSAIRKLTSLSEKLEQLKQSPKSLQNQAVKDALKQLRTPGPGPLSEMSNQLSRGNYSKAAEELSKAVSKLQSGEMSEQEQKAMEQQLQRLAEQLEKLGGEQSAKEQEAQQAQQALENALEKNGLEKSLANDPAALRQALEQAQNLTPEQKKQLEELLNQASQAQAEASACKACNNLGQALDAMKNAMSKDGGQSAQGQLSPEMMQSLQQLAEQFSEMSNQDGECQATDVALQETMSELQELASACKGGECKNMGEFAGSKPGGAPGTSAWKSGWNQAQGNGQGGPGIGRGGQMGEEETDVSFKDEKFRTPTTQGPIISTKYVQGEQVRGEAKAEFAEVAAAADQAVTEALDSNQIPREFHDAIKHYFGRVKAKAKAAEADAAGGTDQPAPAEKPAK